MSLKRRRRGPRPRVLLDQEPSDGIEAPNRTARSASSHTRTFRGPPRRVGLARLDRGEVEARARQRPDPGPMPALAAAWLARPRPPVSPEEHEAILRQLRKLVGEEEPPRAA